MQNISLLLSVILILALGFIVYANSFNAPFIWDDYHLVKDNSYIKSWSHVAKIFTEDIAAGSEKQYNFFRPLQMLTYMIDYSVWKSNVVGYHLTNTLLHIAAALCVYWLANILFSDRLLSLFAGMLFVIHPIHTEAVTFISGRADSLALIFMLLCFIFYLRYLQVKRVASYCMMILCYIAALLTRETSLIIPALILLYHYTFKKKLALNGIVPLAGIVFMYGIFRFTLLADLLPHALSSSTLAERLPGFFAAITDYVRLLFFPLGLHAEYGNVLFSFKDPKVILGILASCSLLVYSYRKRNTNRVLFLSVYWFFIALVPVSNLYPLIIAYMAEHWLYLPSVGFVLILGKALSYLFRKKELRAIGIVYTVCLVVFLSFITIVQNTLWSEPIAFYQKNLTYNPNSIRALNALGMSYVEMGKPEEALPLYEKAITIDPEKKEAYYNLGVAYNELGRRQEAIAMLTEAIRRDRSYGSAYNALGVVYRDLGATDKAAASFRKAMELTPNLANAYINLASAYGASNNHQEAITLYNKAIELNPHFDLLYFNLGNLYRELGYYKEAIASYQKTIEITPGYVDAHTNLGIAYGSIGEREKAIGSFKKAIQLNPLHVKAYNNLGYMYAEAGRSKEAIKIYKEAIRIDPTYAKAYDNLAIAYYHEKEYELSSTYCNKAGELGYRNPGLVEALKPHIATGQHQ